MARSRHTPALLLCALAALAGCAAAVRPLAVVQAQAAAAAAGLQLGARGRHDKGGGGEAKLNLRPLIGIVSQVRRRGAHVLGRRHVAATAARAPASSPPAALCAGAPSPPSTQLGDPAPRGHSYIASSYVKLVESAGARAVPILCDMSREEVERRFKVAWAGWLGLHGGPAGGRLLPGSGGVVLPLGGAAASSWRGRRGAGGVARRSSCLPLRAPRRAPCPAPAAAAPLGGSCQRPRPAFNYL